MTILALLSVLVGAVLGTRFKVMVLLPGIVVAAAVAVLSGLCLAWSLASILSAMIAAALALQFGYLAGVGLHYTLVLLRYRGSAQAIEPVFRPRPIKTSGL